MMEFTLDEVYKLLEKEFLNYYKKNSERMDFMSELVFNDIQNYVTNSFYYGLLKKYQDGENEKGLHTTRLAADFEDLRIHTENTRVPMAFMLTIGNLAMRQARAQFSCNFLACAGYKVVDNLGFKTVEEGVDAALEAGADIIVLCSSDDEYAEYAIPAFKYLDGRAMFVVAGAPACMEDLKAAGIENFVHVRCNVLETLKEYNAKLGI